jgi:hypothetical protein
MCAGGKKINKKNRRVRFVATRDIENRRWFVYIILCIIRINAIEMMKTLILKFGYNRYIIA